MLIKGKINPLNLLEVREVLDPPPHFEYIYTSLRHYDIDKIKHWIYQNLSGRFYIGESLELDDNQLTIKTKIGFEEPKEASFFLLACSDLISKKI